MADQKQSDPILLDAYRRRLQAIAAPSGAPSHLSDGGGGGTSDGMEARVKRLEDDFKEIRADLKTLLREVAEIKGKVSSLPTTLQLVGFAIAIFAASGMLRWFGR